MVSESQSRADHFESLSRDISRHVSVVQELLTLAQQLHHPCNDRDVSLQQLSSEVQLVRAQHQEQLSNDRHALSELESATSQSQRLLGHKDSEISRLMSEVSSLKSDKLRLEESLVVLSASSIVQSRHRGAPVMLSRKACR